MTSSTGLRYSIQEYTTMHFLYGKHNGNALAASVEFNEAHGTNVKSSTLQDVHQRLRETGCVYSRRHEMGMSAIREEEIDEVEAAAAANPRISTRQIERDTGIFKRQRSESVTICRPPFFPRHTSTQFGTGRLCKKTHNGELVHNQCREDRQDFIHRRVPL